MKPRRPAAKLDARTNQSYPHFYQPGLVAIGGWPGIGNSQFSPGFFDQVGQSLLGTSHDSAGIEGAYRYLGTPNPGQQLEFIDNCGHCAAIADDHIQVIF